MFGRKKHKVEDIHNELLEELLKPPCQRKGGDHKWRDFPAYLAFHTSPQTVIEIREPYVCIYCGLRNDVNLQTMVWNNRLKKSDFEAELDRVQNEYKDLLKPRAIVEDMVNDAIMVDRETLKYWDQIHGLAEEKKETEEERLERYKTELIGKKE